MLDFPLGDIDRRSVRDEVWRAIWQVRHRGPFLSLDQLRKALLSVVNFEFSITDQGSWEAGPDWYLLNDQCFSLGLATEFRERAQQLRAARDTATANADNACACAVWDALEGHRGDLPRDPLQEASDKRDEAFSRADIEYARGIAELFAEILWRDYEAALNIAREAA